MKFISFCVVLLFVCLIGLSWHQQHNNYQQHDNKLTDSISVQEHIEAYPSYFDTESEGAYRQIPTGLYIDSLKFKSANDVHISGYVWQEFSEETKTTVPHGVLFPDAVEELIFKQAYSNVVGDTLVVGWYFEANLRQRFSYEHYPIDHKTVSIKLLPIDFNSSVILVPSLKSYTDLSRESIFAIADNMVLQDWEIRETYFDFVPVVLSTDFGLHNSHPRTNFPELSFNIVIERKFFSAFMVNVTLLLVSMGLLYSLVMMLTSDKKLRKKYDLGVSSSIASCAGIFFILLMAHISLREKFSSYGVVYIEYFYLLSYAFILLTALVSYVFSHYEDPNEHMFFVNDAYALKLGFWPLYFSLIYIITYWHFGAY